MQVNRNLLWNWKGASGTGNLKYYRDRKVFLSRVCRR